MKYNKKYTIVITLLLGVLLTNCSSFLEEEPENFRSSTNFFDDEPSLEVGLNGLYQTLKSMYDAHEPAIGNLGTDESVGLFANRPFDKLSKYQLTSLDQDYVMTYYTRNFELITRANVIIERGALLEQTDNVAKIIAEAKFLRGLGYFRLATFFGPVPIVLSEVTGTDYSLPRAPLKDVYEIIIRDFTESSKEGILENVMNPANPQRVTRLTIKAYLGKVYLTMASHKDNGIIEELMAKVGKPGYGYGSIEQSSQELLELGKAELEEIIELDVIDLHPHYGEVFVVENQNEIPECMWDLQFSGLAPTGSYFLKKYGMKMFGAPTPETMVLTNGCGLTQMFYTYNVYQAYAEGDMRREWNLSTERYDYGQKQVLSFANELNRASSNYGVQSWMAPIKYRFSTTGNLWDEIPYTDRFNLPMNFKMMRYSDILLMYSEIEIRLNGGMATQPAVDSMNRIIDRARGLDSEGNPIPEGDTPFFRNYTIADLTLDAILKERMLELCFEGHRWFDLTRYGILIEKYNEPELHSNIKQAEISNNQYLAPLPQSEIDVTTNPEGFFQNPGY